MLKWCENKALFLLTVIRVNLGKWIVRNLINPPGIYHRYRLDSMSLVDNYFLFKTNSTCTVTYKNV